MFERIFAALTNAEAEDLSCAALAGATLVAFIGMLIVGLMPQ
jgi:hypothetical protein